MANLMNAKIEGILITRFKAWADDVLVSRKQKSFPRLKKQKADAPPGRPAEEALEAIYLTPDFLFALACAARPPGTTQMDLIKRTIRFENPDLFEPDQTVYIYFVDATKIPEDRKIAIDAWQIAVIMDEITPDKVETYKSSEVLRHYRLIEE